MAFHRNFSCVFLTDLCRTAGEYRTAGEKHRVRTSSGIAYTGTWEEIVLQMKMDDRELSEASVKQYMARASLRSRSETGVAIPVSDAESFIRGAAAAGVLMIIS